jgi:hypothetical protein
MPVIVDSSFYQQPEEPGFLESLAAGFGQGFSKGVESAMEEKSEADRFERAKQAELEKMREAAKIRAEEAKAERGWLGTWKEREFKLQEEAGKLARDKFQADLDQWQQGADLRQTQLDALRQKLASDTAMSDIDRKKAEMELTAGENAIANEAAERMMAVRNSFAVGLGGGDVKRGNAQLDAAEGLVNQALKQGNYREANRILGMVQRWASRSKLEYDNKLAQDTVDAIQKNGNIQQFPDLQNELQAIANDSSMSLAQRASMATALSDRARNRTSGISLKASYDRQIQSEIAGLEQKMVEAEDPAVDEQLQARIIELTLLGANIQSVDPEDLRGLLGVIQDGRSAFFRSGSESMANVRSLFGGQSAAVGGMASYLPSDAVKSLSEQNELLGKMVESTQADIDELTGLMEDMDEDDPEFLGMQAELQDLKAHQNAIKAQRRGIFRSMYPPPTPSGNGKNGSGKAGVSPAVIEGAMFGGGGEEPPPSYGKGMTSEQRNARIKALDKIQEQEGLSTEESDERDALYNAEQAENQGRAGADMQAAGVKQAAANLRKLFPKEKYSITKVYSRKDADVMLGHYRQLLENTPTTPGAATGPRDKASVEAKEKRDAIEAVIKELQNMIDTGSYASKPKTK